MTGILRGRRGFFRPLAAVVVLMELCPARCVEAEVAEEPPGRFLRSYWYEPGIEHGNPFFNSRFRVNAPEAVLQPSFMNRSEVRGNGMMQILMEEDLSKLSGAELYFELWGGHPGTASKRVTLNGRSTYSLPEVGAPANNCTHSYPTIPVKITDLVNGYNVLQFACDQGTSFWGHFIVDNASLRAVLKDNDPDLRKAGLADVVAALAVPEIDRKTEIVSIRLDIPEAWQDKVSSVEFWGHYCGYDENGNGETTDWHGFTKDRLPQAILGTDSQPPFAVKWDISMLPAQDQVAVKAIIHFKEHPELIYETRAVTALDIPPRKDVRVELRISEDLPQPFWSRASKANECTIIVGEEPERIERAELHVVIWDGGRGSTEHPFTLNGHPLPVVGEGRHDVLYRVVPVDASILRRGPNHIVVLSDTDHHGIEVLLPGPALAIRSRP